MLSSVANALRAFEFLVERGDAGVSEIGRHLGVTVGTSHRILVTLVELGFAEQDAATRRYRPSSKVLSLAEQMRGRVEARDRVHLYLVELVQAVRETAHLAVLDDGVVLYIDKVASDQPFGIEFRVGSRMPAFATALGRALIAFDDGIDLDLIAKAGKSIEPSIKPGPRDKLIASLAAVRAEGVAEDLGDLIADAHFVAAPITGRHGRVVAAIDVAAPRSRYDGMRDQLRTEVKRSAERISEALRQLGVDDLAS